MAFRSKYEDIIADAPSEAKAKEREILQKSADLLRAASEPDGDPLLAIEALHFTSRIWTVFLSDLAKPDNQLPVQTRASLISIGIAILKEVDLNRSEGSRKFNDIVELTEIIMDGLK